MSIELFCEILLSVVRYYKALFWAIQSCSVTLKNYSRNLKLSKHSLWITSIEFIEKIYKYIIAFTLKSLNQFLFFLIDIAWHFHMKLIFQCWNENVYETNVNLVPSIVSDYLCHGYSSYIFLLLFPLNHC